MSAPDFIVQGGFVMYPLLFASLLVWGIFLERLWFLANFCRQFRQLCRACQELLARGTDPAVRGQARGLAGTLPTVIASPYLAVIDSRESSLGRRLSETRSELSRAVWVLGTVASSSPFIGLFGTVVGIIKSFDSIAVSGKAGFAVVAGGLSEALIATAAGIIVAVVALIFYNWLQMRIRQAALEFQNALEDLASVL